MRVIERYPVRLVNAVLKVLRQEVEKRYQLGALEAGQHVDEPDVWLTNPEFYEEIYGAETWPGLGRKSEEHRNEVPG